MQQKRELNGGVSEVLNRKKNDARDKLHFDTSVKFIAAFLSSWVSNDETMDFDDISDFCIDLADKFIDKFYNGRK